MAFVGIDVSQATLDVTILDAEQTTTSRWATTPAAIAGLVTSLAATPPTLLVLEATGVYHLALVAALAQAGLPLSLVNPVQVKGLRQTLGLRTKTDQVAARLVAQCAQTYADQLRRWVPSSALQQELAGWMTQRDQVVERLPQLRGRLAAARRQPTAGVTEALRADLAAATRQREHADAQIRALLAGIPEAAVLLELVGVGLVTAAAVLAWLPSELWGQAKPAAAYAGGCPQITASGQQERSHLSAHGHRRMRRMLYGAARVAVSHDPRLRACYERLLAAGKPATSALCAAMHTLLRWMMGRIRRLHRSQSALAA